MTELNERCSECNRSLPPGSRFCPRCGASTTGEPATVRTVQQRPFWTELLDRSWDFFASTRVAVVLILLLAVLSVAGSLVDQESQYQDWRPPYLFYPAKYGQFWGNLFMKIGLTHTYTSWWYMTVIWLLVISLIVCSLHRLIPLYKVLSRPQVKKAEHFVRHQPILFSLPTESYSLDQLEQLFRKRGYRIWRKDENLHADRGTISRYGAYILHVGLILVAVAATMRVLPGWNVTKDAWIADGQTATIEGLPWQVKSNQFILKLFPSGIPARYATDLTILQDGQPVKTGTTEVNHAVNYNQYDIYQASFRREYGTATFDVKVGEGAKAVKVGSLTMDLRRPEPSYQVAPNLKVVVEQYYNDAVVDASGQPGNGSPAVKHPAMVLAFEDASGKAMGRQGLAFAEMGERPTPGEKIGAPQVAVDGPIYLDFVNYQVRWYTGLRLHKDLTVPYFYTGLGVVLLGLWIGFFIFHQQIWALQVGDQILVGARTNKNKYALRQSLQVLLKATPLPDRSKEEAAEQEVDQEGAIQEEAAKEGDLH